MPPDPVVAGLTLDSRKVQPGYLFAALAGSRADGATFINDAVRRGATAILAASGVVLPPIDKDIYLSCFNRILLNSTHIGAPA